MYCRNDKKIVCQVKVVQKLYTKKAVVWKRSYRLCFTLQLTMSRLYRKPSDKVQTIRKYGLHFFIYTGGSLVAYHIKFLKLGWSAFLNALNTLLKVEMLENLTCSATSVIGSDGSSKRFSALLILLRFR